MAYRDPAVGRERDRARFRRRTAERRANGLCPRCGLAPPAASAGALARTNAVTASATAPINEVQRMARICPVACGYREERRGIGRSAPPRYRRGPPRQAGAGPVDAGKAALGAVCGARELRQRGARNAAGNNDGPPASMIE